MPFSIVPSAATLGQTETVNDVDYVITEHPEQAGFYFHKRVSIDTPGTSFGDVTNNFTKIQESTWVTTNNEAEIDLGGSPTQKTTLTGLVTNITFTGSVPANRTRAPVLEITHAEHSIDIPAVNDPATQWPARRAELQAATTHYEVHFSIASDGTPRYAGAR